MKLSKRILLLIAPVIIISAAASSYIIYASQKDALIKREDSYLQLNMEKLAGHFRQARSFLNSYAYTLTKSDIIRQYFLNAQNPYRELELIENLQETIKVLQAGDSSFSSLAILDSNQDLLYYAENSTDPFAEIDPAILHHVKQKYQTSLAASDINYVLSSQGDGMLVRYEVLDKRTIARPLIKQQDDIFFVVVSVSLDKFNTLRRQIEFDNQTSIFASSEPINTNKGLTQSIKLANDLYITVDPAQFILNNKLQDIWRQLILSFGTSALITVLLLLILLYRYVINPITRLDKQLQQVEKKQRDNIQPLNTNDEMGRLSTRFYDMYNELDNTYRKTKTLAENDHLTKLANRHQFQNYANSILSSPLASCNIWVLYIDLDNFKFVNDQYGHQVGDSLLVEFAEQVTRLCDDFSHQYGTKSLASRLSGDEFAIFICSPNNFKDAAKAFAEQILAPLQGGFKSEFGSFPITASIGVATYPLDGDHIEKLLSNADTAMYQAKRAGKNQFAHYSLDLDKIVQRRSNIERALRSHQYIDEFSLVFMPYLNTQGTEVIGVEALLRWHSEQLGFISPDEFIPIAEQTGLFEEIDRWVIAQSFARFDQLQTAFDIPVQLSINLSSAELSSTKLAMFIEEHAQQYGIPRHLIDFEITETFAADSKGFPLLYKLSKLGYNLAIDDFGSGYTSITQLVQYPVQKIKFDRLFLETLVATNNQNVIKPLIELCHAQSKTVTAEGIETQEMHEWLADQQCDFMQGYYFGKPMDIDQLSTWYQQLKGL